MTYVLLCASLTWVYIQTFRWGHIGRRFRNDTERLENCLHFIEMTTKVNYNGGFAMVDRDVVLIRDLLKASAEGHIVEFKHNNTDAKMIGKLISALSNSARKNNKPFAYIVWGIEDGTHDPIGTSFDPEIAKVGNQPLQIWLSNQLRPRVDFGFRRVDYEGNNLVLLEIPPALNAPIEFERTAYIRIGEATPRLSDNEQAQAALWREINSFTWETAVAKKYVTADQVLNLLDYPKYFELTKIRLPDNRVGIFERLAADGIIESDVGENWNITNLGAILFAKRLSDISNSISRKGMRLIQYDGTHRANTVLNRYDADMGYASGFDGLMNYITALFPKIEHIGMARRTETILYSEVALRELIANAIIHQNMTVIGAGPQIEVFSDRIEITNPGAPLVDPNRFLDLAPKSRNNALASAMRRMGFCEEQGSGVDKVLLAVEAHQMPAPEFRHECNSVRVTLLAPRRFADMTSSERIRACYLHAALKWVLREPMKNATLCERLGIDRKNSAQASNVIRQTLEKDLIKHADPNRPRTAYLPYWA